MLSNHLKEVINLPKRAEYLSGMRAMRRWKTHFAIKPDLGRAKSIL